MLAAFCVHDEEWRAYLADARPSTPRKARTESLLAQGYGPSNRLVLTCWPAGYLGQPGREGAHPLLG
jgi:hypothetical protein